MDFQVGEEHPLPGLEEHSTVLTQMESSSQEIHKSLKAILDFQTHHRLREAQSRKRAEDINERVLYWSLTGNILYFDWFFLSLHPNLSFLETCAVLVIAIGQVIILRNFFSEKRPSQMSSHNYGRL